MHTYSFIMYTTDLTSDHHNGIIWRLTNDRCASSGYQTSPHCPVAHHILYLRIILAFTASVASVERVYWRFSHLRKTDIEPIEQMLKFRKRVNVRSQKLWPVVHNKKNYATLAPTTLELRRELHKLEKIILRESKQSISMTLISFDSMSLYVDY